MISCWLKLSGIVLAYSREQHAGLNAVPEQAMYWVSIFRWAQVYFSWTVTLYHRVHKQFFVFVNPHSLS